MIIKNDPNYEKRKAEEERLNRSEEERKEELLDLLRKESVSVISLACIYAKQFETYGVNVIDKWDTAEKQIEALRSVYKDGYDRGLVKGVGIGQARAEDEIAQIRAGMDNRKSESFVEPKPLTIRRRNPTKKKRKR